MKTVVTCGLCLLAGVSSATCSRRGVRGFASTFLASGYLMSAVADLRKVDPTADAVRTRIRVNDADELEAVIQRSYRRWAPQ